MDLSGISSTSAPASQAAVTQQAAGALVMKKILDIEATQGAMLAQMVAQSAGLGGTIDFRA
jgi:hypothetical protein